MKNETISRLILVLEIAAIILFHSLKSNTVPEHKIAQDSKDPNPIVFQASSPLVINTAK
jgi:hypothetical protein